MRGHTDTNQTLKKYFVCQIILYMPGHTLKLTWAQKPPLLQNIAIQKKRPQQFSSTTCHNLAIFVFCWNQWCKRLWWKKEKVFFSQHHTARVKEPMLTSHSEGPDPTHGCIKCGPVAGKHELSGIFFITFIKRKDQFCDLVPICSTQKSRTVVEAEKLQLVYLECPEWPISSLAPHSY